MPTPTMLFKKKCATGSVKKLYKIFVLKNSNIMEIIWI